MEKDKLEIQVLLEIALNQRITGEVETSLLNVLKLYLRKLNCLWVAVCRNGEWSITVPKALTSNTEWMQRLNNIANNFEEGKTEPVYYQIENNYLYGFPLFEYEWLVLLRKSRLKEEMFFELNKVVHQLGRDLLQAKEEQRLKLLQQLFDHSSDAIQISEENGRLYYINQVAAERLGIDFRQVANHFVSDVDVLFKDPNQWLSYVAKLKEKGQMILEGVNLNQKTGNEIPVEVTANLIEVNAKLYVIADSRDITVRKRQEQKLKDTTQKLESIFNEMNDVIWSVSVPDYNVIFVTPSVKDMYEIDVEEWMKDSQWWQKVIHHDDAHIVDDIYKKLRKKGYYNVKYRIITPSGKEKWIRNKGKLIYDENCNPIRLDGVVTDRTQQYIAQEVLKQELRLQEALIDIASTYINIDPKDVENTINSSLKKMGLFVSSDRAYIFEYNFNKNTTSNTYEWCNEGVEAEINNLQNVPMEFFPQWIEQHQKGDAFYVPNVSVLNDDGEGGLKSILEPQGIKSLITIPMLDGRDLIGFVGFDSVKNHYDYSEKEQRLLFLFGQMLINIRNRQKWENQLLIQEEKYRNIIANMNLGLLELDMNDKILYANQSFCEISGYSLAELKGNRAADLLLNKEQRQLIYDKNNKRIKGITDSYELEITDKQRNKKYWFISGAPYYNDKGHLVGSIGVHLDITAQKQLERDLAEAKNFAEAAAKAKELFLANMSHEIRTPLNVIIGMIRQLAKENLNTDQQFYVKQSDSSAKHLLTILNNILDIAKIESGDMEIVKKPFSPGALAFNVHSIMYSQAKDKNLDFKINVSPEIKPVFEGDETRLRQVLINLLGNAIKFTDNGSINLSVELLDESHDAQQLKFEVSDTGIGMSNEFISRIFDKFSQEHDSSNRKYDGTGLGMAISRDLINLMGGEMTVLSEKNKGTSCSFVLYLPMGNQELLFSKSQQEMALCFKGMKALLVEDNDMNRLIAMQSLDYLGFKTSEAENGQVAIEKIQEEHFDLILMDIQMPVMDGVEATKYMREKLKIDTPIIALTANAFKHDIDLYLNKGMNDYITKPYDEQDFFRKIEHVLSLADTDKLIVDGKVDKNIKTIIENAAPLYDLGTIEKMSRGNQEFVKKMIGIFISIVTENMQVLQTALDENDVPTIQKTAHKIKPSIDQMRISSLKEVVRKLENFDTNTISQQELKSLVSQMSFTLNQIVDDLKKK